MHARKLTVAVVSLLLAACGGDGDDKKPAGSNNTTGTNNSTTNDTTASNNNTANNTTGTTNALPGPSGTGLAATADFGTMVSAFHRVDLAGADYDDISLGEGDIAIALGTSYAFAIDRASDAVRVLARDGLAEAGTIELPTASNPNDAVDVNGKIYVSLYDVGAVSVADGPGATPQAIDLFSLDTFDANPEPSAMIADDGYALVVLQRLQDFAPVESSLLLVIDSSNDTYSTVDLGMGNAQAGLRHFGGSFAVGVTGNYGTSDGGVLAIERAAAGDYSAGELLVDEATLGGDLLDFVFVSPTAGYAVISLPDFTSQLVRFEVGGAVTPVAGVEAPGFAGLDVSADGQWLAVGDRGEAQGFLFFEVVGDGLAAPLEIAMPGPPAGFRFVAP